MANFIRSLCMVISSAFFTMIPKLYGLFYDLAAQPTLFLPETLQKLSNNIYVLVSVVMLFALAMKSITAIVNPELLGDSKKGVLGVLKRAFIALVLIIVIPFGFKWFYDFQTEVMSKSLIEKVILGMALDEGENVESKYNVGQILASTTLQSVLYPSDGDECNPGVGVGLNLSAITFPTKKLVDVDLSSFNLCSAYNKAIEEDVSYTQSMITAINAETGFRAGTNASDIGTEGLNGNYYVLTFEYWGLLAVVVSGVIVYMLVLFCIDSAVRLIKMGFLELTAPISVVAYIYGGNDVLKNWFKEVFNTAISFFVRVAALAFMALILTRIPDFISNFNENYQNLARLFLVIGTLIFVKKAPELVEKLLGIKINLQGGIGGRLGQMAGVGKLAQGAWNTLKGAGVTTAGMAVAGVGALAKGGARTFDNKFNNGKGRAFIDKIKNSDGFQGVSSGLSAFKAGSKAGGGFKSIKAAADSWKASPMSKQMSNRATLQNVEADKRRRQQINESYGLTKDGYAKKGATVASRAKANSQMEHDIKNKEIRHAISDEGKIKHISGELNKAKEVKTKILEMISEEETTAKTTGRIADANSLHELHNKIDKNSSIDISSLISEVSNMSAFTTSKDDTMNLISKMGNTLEHTAKLAAEYEIDDEKLKAVYNDDGTLKMGAIGTAASVFEKKVEEAKTKVDGISEANPSLKEVVSTARNAIDTINKQDIIDHNISTIPSQNNSAIPDNNSGNNSTVDSTNSRVNVTRTSDGMLQTDSGIVIPDTQSTRNFVNINNDTNQSINNNQSSNGTSQNSSMQDLSSYFDGLSNDIKDSAASTNSVLSDQLRTQQNLVSEMKNQNRSVKDLSNNIDNLNETIEKVVKNTDKVSREIKTGNEKINDENNKKNNE